MPIWSLLRNILFHRRRFRFGWARLRARLKQKRFWGGFAAIFLLLYGVMGYVINWHFIAQAQANYLEWGKPIHLKVIGKPVFSLGFPLAITFDEMQIIPEPGENPALPLIRLEKVKGYLSIGSLLKGKLYADRIESERAVVEVAGTKVVLQNLQTILDDGTGYGAAMHGEYDWDGQRYQYTVDVSFRQDFPAMTFKVTLQENDGRKLALDFSGIGSRFDRKVVLEFDNIRVGEAVGVGTINLKPGSTLEAPIGLSGRFSLNKFTDRRSFFSDQDFALMVNFANTSRLLGGLSMVIDALTLQGLSLKKATLAGTMKPGQPVALRAATILPSGNSMQGTGQLVVVPNDYWHIRDIRLTSKGTTLKGDIAYRYGAEPLYKVDFSGEKLTLDNLKSLETEPWLNEARMLRQPLQLRLRLGTLITPGAEYPGLRTSATLTRKAITIQTLDIATTGGTGLFEAGGSLTIDGLIPWLTMDFTTKGAALSALAPSGSLAEFWLARLNGALKFSLKGPLNRTELTASHTSRSSQLQASGTLQVLSNPVLFNGKAHYRFQQYHGTEAVTINASTNIIKDAAGGHLEGIQGRIGEGVFWGDMHLKKTGGRYSLRGGLEVDKVTMPAAIRVMQFLPASAQTTVKPAAEEEDENLGVVGNPNKCAVISRIPFSGHALGLSKLAAYDVDLSAHVAEIRRQSMAYRNNTLKIQVQNGALNATFRGDNSLGGSVLANVNASDRGGTPAVLTDVRLNSYVVTNAARTASGAVTMQWNSNSFGDCLATQLGTLEGIASAAVRDVRLPGVNLSAINQALGRFQGLGQLQELQRTIRTPSTLMLNELRVGLKVADGLAVLENGRALFEGGSARLKGGLNILEQSLDINGAVSFDSIPASPPLEMQITGPLAAPVIQALNQKQIAKFLFSRSVNPFAR